MAHLATAILRISSGETKSTSLGDFFGKSPAKVGLDNCKSISIKAPAALTAAVTVQGAMIKNSVDADFATIQSPSGTDLAIVAGKITVLPDVAVKDLRLISAGAEAADRDFIVSLHEEMR